MNNFHIQNRTPKRTKLFKNLLTKKWPAFTAIELMITLAVIALLTTASAIAYMDYVKRGRDAARGEMARSLNSSVMAYISSNGGNPPADPEDFTAFLASTGESFGKGRASGESLSFVDPAGGKNVCLDAEKGVDQPCSFNYTAYDDGTYAISYGIEHTSSRKENFYKTTDSVPAAGEKTQEPLLEQSIEPKYGVYVGNAKYIGKPVTDTNGDTIKNDDGVDEKYGSEEVDDEIQPLTPIFRSIRIDNPAGVSQLARGNTCSPIERCEGDFACLSSVCRTANVASGDPCEVTEQCIGALSCLSGVCRTTEVPRSGTCEVTEQCVSGLACTGGVCETAICGNGLKYDGYATVVAEDGTCWLATNLGTKILGGIGNYYQSKRKTAGWSGSTWNGTGENNGDPCPSGSHTPHQEDWAHLMGANNNTNGIQYANNGKLQLPRAGFRGAADGALTETSKGYYWSSTGKDPDMYILHFYPDYMSTENSINSASALPVRCIIN